MLKNKVLTDFTDILAVALVTAPSAFFEKFQV